MNYKEAVCQAAIALWASAKPGYNSDPEAAVEQGVKIADELRIKGFLDSFEKNPDPVEFHP